MLLSFQLAVFITLFQTVISVDHVTIVCTHNCKKANVVNKEVIGVEGKTITLQYKIKTVGLSITRATILDLEYDNSRIMQVFLKDQVVEKKIHPSFINFNGTTLVNTTTNEYSFSFEVGKLNMTLHDGKVFKYTLSLGPRDEINSVTLVVKKESSKSSRVSGGGIAGITVVAIIYYWYCWF